jgi:DNA invertase Pin-like site-specific DNA recombinase
MKTVAVYLRISTSKQDHASQESELRAYCEARGWKNVIEFRDIESGSSRSRRGLDEMLAMVRKRKLSAVVCAKIDRIARSLPHFCQIVSELRFHGVSLVIPAQQIDTTSENPCGELTMNILAVIASFERQLIVSRVKNGLAAARSRGVRLGRKESLSKQQPEVAAMLAAGKGIRETARLLDYATVRAF